MADKEREREKVREIEDWRRGFTGCEGVCIQVMATFVIFSSTIKTNLQLQQHQRKWHAKISKSRRTKDMCYTHAFTHTYYKCECIFK